MRVGACTHACADSLTLKQRALAFLAFTTSKGHSPVYDQLRARGFDAHIDFFDERPELGQLPSMLRSFFPRKWTPPISVPVFSAAQGAQAQGRAGDTAGGDAAPGAQGGVEPGDDGAALAARFLQSDGSDGHAELWTS